MHPTAIARVPAPHATDTVDSVILPHLTRQAEKRRVLYIISSVEKETK